MIHLSTGGEASMTAGGGNLIEAEVKRNERSVRRTVATIELAEGRLPSRRTPVLPVFFLQLFPAETVRKIDFLHPIPPFKRLPV